MQYVIGVLVGFAVLWLVLVIGLIVARPKGLRAADAARLMPDVLRLTRALARDRALPRRVRMRIWILLAWLVSPIDAIPDVIPVIGFADDIIITYFVLRSVARAVGNDVLAQHWRGSPEGLVALERLLRLDKID